MPRPKGAKNKKTIYFNKKNIFGNLFTFKRRYKSIEDEWLDELCIGYRKWKGANEEYAEIYKKLINLYMK